MLTWFLLGFMIMGCAIWFMYRNDKTFEEQEVTDKTAMKHEMKTVGGLVFLVAGSYLVLFIGIVLLLKFLFTPW